MSKLTHKQRIAQIYPIRPEDRAVNSTHLSSFVYYAQSRPAKLSKVVPYLEMIILKDKDSNKQDHVLIGNQILGALAKDCGQNLNFFVEPLINTLAELLATGNPHYIEAASNTFSLFSKSNNEQTHCNPTLLPTYKKCIDSFLKYSKDTSNLHVKKAGIQGIRSVILDQNMSRLDTEVILKKVFPSVFDVILPLAQYPSNLTADMLNATLITDEVSLIAITTFKETIARSSIFSLQWTVQALFSWLDGANKWTEGEFTLFFFQIIMIALHSEYYQALVSEVLTSIDAYKGTSFAIKTSMVRVLTYVISVARDSVGVSILELLDSLLTRLVGSLDLKKEDVTEEIGLQQAIIDSIEMLLSKVTLSQVRNECLDFILKRLETETDQIQKKFPEEEAESQNAVLRKTFLKILEKLSASEVFVERALASYPTLANRHLLLLLKDADPGVRGSVHVVWEQLLVQALAKRDNPAQLAPEERFFLDTYFGTTFHQAILATSLAAQVTPVDFLGVHKLLTTLLTFFSPDLLAYTIPFVFKLQEESQGVDGSPKQRGAHNLVLQTLISIAEQFKASKLLAYLNDVKTDRNEQHQWLPTLDFQPGEMKAMKNKTVKDLDKKKANKPNPKDTLIPKAKFLALLLEEVPSLKALASAMETPFVDKAELDDEDDDAIETVNLSTDGTKSLNDPRRQSAPVLLVPAAASEAIVNPSVLKNLMKEPFGHSFDSLTYVSLDTQKSVVDFLATCLGDLGKSSKTDILHLPESTSMNLPVFEVS